MKKLFVTLAALCLAGVFCVAATYKRGDVNGDGRVDVSDVTTLVDVILGKATSVPGNTDVDLNGAKNPDVSDVTALVDIILGKHEQDLYLMNLYQAKYMSAVGTDGYPTLNNNDARVCHIVTTVNGSVITIKGTNGQPDVTLDGEWDIVPCTDGYNILKADDHSKALMFNQDLGTCTTVDNLADYYNADLAIWKLDSPAAYAEYSAKKRFTVAALNVDGMPQSVKILGVYDLKLNPDAKEAAGATAIGKKLKTMGWDVIGVSEDFNYHSQIWNQAWNNGVNDENGQCYNATTHRGDINITAGSYAAFLGQKTIFDTDGLCVFYNTNTVNKDVLESSEKWVKWNEHYGYTDHGADGLIDKGYRFYVVRLNDGTEFDFYTLHMDADSDTPDNAARETQLKQLANAILASHNGRPIIIAGDTNCRYTRDRIKTAFIDAINSDSRFTCKDPWIEFGRRGKYPKYGSNSIMAEDKSDPSNKEGMEGFLRGEVVDKCWYINNTESDIRIVAESYHQDLSFINEEGEPLADHWPCVVEFSYHDYDPAIDDVEEEEEKDENDLSGTYYLRNRETGKFLKAGGMWGTHAVQGEYGAKMEMTLVNGKYTLESPIGGLTQGDPYMDQTAAEWTLVQNGTYYSFTYDDNGTTKALTGNDVTTFPYGPNTRYVTCANYNAADSWQQWELLTKAELEVEMANASEEKPFNCTHLLPGANFDRNDGDGNASWEGWPTTATRMTCNYQDGQNGVTYSNFVAEVYVANCTKIEGSCKHDTKWDVYQTISGLPNGKYMITNQAFQRISNSNTTTASIYLYGVGKDEQSTMVQLMYNNTVNPNAPKITDQNYGGTTKDGNYYYPNSMAEAALYFNAGFYQNAVTVEVNNGTLKVGIKKTSDTGKNNTAWTCFDNFQLFYLGPVEAQQ